MVGSKRPNIVIVGAGFGGLWAARALANSPTDVLLVDRNNYHTFMPLLYQVAAAELSPSQIINPVRSILRRQRNLRFSVAEVEAIKLEENTLRFKGGALAYDYLILAPGSTPYFFGTPGADEYAYTLRTLDDGVTLRNHVLSCFERAVDEPDQELRQRLLTFAIVGGGPTGVEFTGALYELIHGNLRKDFSGLDFRQVRVVLLEALDGLLPGMRKRLGRYALARLQTMGIEVKLNTPVGRVEKETVYLQNGEIIPTETVVWTAGHRGHPLAEASGLATDRRGQVAVEPTLQLPGHSNVYVVGDLAAFNMDGKPLPMVAPVAMQQGEAAAENILRQTRGEEPQPFRYRDSGMLAVIGRNAAVADFGRLSFTGFFAWLLWLVVHLIKLIGFRNRLQVLVNWAWSYFFFDKAARVIVPAEGVRRQREVKSEAQGNVGVRTSGGE